MMRLGELPVKLRKFAPRWIIAIVAFGLVSLACDPYPPTGVTCLIQAPDGSILAPDSAGGYASVDGGITWTPTGQQDYYSYCGHPYPVTTTWTKNDPHDSSIRYRFTTATSIERSSDGGATWHREIDLAGTEARAVYYVRFRKTGYEYRAGPTAAVFHEPSGNLIVSMVLEGVLVRRPDGHWDWIAVGPYSRADMRDLTITIPLILEELVLGVMIALMTFASLAVLARRSNFGRVMGLAALSLVVAPIVFMLGGAMSSVFSGISGPIGDYFRTVLTITWVIAMFMTPAILGWLVGGRSRQANRFEFGTVVAGWTYIIGGLLATALFKVGEFTVSSAPIGFVALPIALACIPNLIHQFREKLRVLAALALFGIAGFLIFAVCYFLWGIGGIPFHRIASALAGVLTLINLFVGTRVVKWIKPELRADPPVISEPAPAE